MLRVRSSGTWRLASDRDCGVGIFDCSATATILFLTKVIPDELFSVILLQDYQR